MKILVADDSVTMRKILQMTFAGVQRAEVVTVASGKEAIEKARALKPDVVLADASMSSPDGYDVAKALKADPALSATAVIVLVSNQHPYDTARGKAAGVDDHIVKPFETQALLDKVAAAVGRPRAAAPSTPGPTSGASRSAPPFRRTGVKSTIAFGAPPIPAPGASGPSGSSARPAAKPATPSVPALELVPEPELEISEPAAPPPRPAAAPQKPSAASSEAAPEASSDAALQERLRALGLSEEQLAGVLQITREAVERVVWEVVPDLAETIIREEIRRLTTE